MSLTRALKNSNHQVSKFKSGFDIHGRFKQAHRFEAELKQHLIKSYKLSVFSHGLGVLPPNERAELVSRTDQTSLHVRFQPDFWIPVPNQNLSFFVDAKSQLAETDFYSVNEQAFNVQCELMGIGDLILWVFQPSSPISDYKAEWLNNLCFLINWEKDSQRLHEVRGSKKSFGLIKKDKLRSLDTVINQWLRFGCLK